MGKETWEILSGYAETFVAGTASSSGDTTILPAVADKKIHIQSIMFNNAGATDVTVNLGFTIKGASKTRFPVLLKPGSIFSRKIDFNFIECDINTPVIITLSGSVNVNYDMDYELV